MFPKSLKRFDNSSDGFHDYVKVFGLFNLSRTIVSSLTIKLEFEDCFSKEMTAIEWSLHYESK